MYLGSRDPHTQEVMLYDNDTPVIRELTWVPAVFTAFREILDNALDEVVTEGHGNRIDVTYDPETMVFSVTDNGRGIPITFDKTIKQYIATAAMVETKAGRNFGDDRGATRGLNGVGASIVNFCSEFFNISIRRDKKHFSQSFSEDLKKNKLNINDATIFPDSNKQTGTRVDFKLSSHVFKHLILPEELVKSRMFEVAMIYPKLKIFYNGQQLKAKQSIEKTIFGNNNPIKITIESDTAKFLSNFYLVPEFMDDGTTDFVHSIVNAIPVFNGGTHVDSFRKLFYSGLVDALKKDRSRKNLSPNRSDISGGMLLFNVTEMDAPSFDSQSKTRLINEWVISVVRHHMADAEFFKKIIKNNPAWIERIYERCAIRTQKQDARDVNRLAKQNLRVKIEDLDDACGRDRSKSILFLGEGKSAISGMVEARNPDIHGGLPLRGKILNVFGQTKKTVMENAALANIMNAIGLVPGQRVNRSTLRYGKVYICTDADEDGKNIAALLVNFFFLQWPELFDENKEPFIYIFDTPLIIAVKGKTRKYWYNDNYHMFEPDKFKGWEITRAKGLAALKMPDWKHVIGNPKLRPIINEYYIDEHGNTSSMLAETLDLLFNSNRAGDRKEWIGM